MYPLLSSRTRTVWKMFDQRLMKTLATDREPATDRPGGSRRAGRKPAD